MKPEIRIFIGYDERESVAYHVAVQSIIENCSDPNISITPLRTDKLKSAGIYKRNYDPKASNAFSYTRFLVPYLSFYEGTSVYMDPDVLLKSDIKGLLDYCSGEITCPVWVVKHDYTPKRQKKYFGARQYKYPMKNWSSVMVFKNSQCAVLTPEYVNKATPQELHQFKWLNSRENGFRTIGRLPKQWNWLVEEYAHNDSAYLLHYTNGIPAIDGFDRSDHADDWWEYYDLAQRARV